MVTLRAPALIVLVFAFNLVAAWLAFTFAASDFQGLNPISLRVLIWPALIGAALASLSLWRGHRRGTFPTRVAPIWRCAVGVGAAGFAWPLSFGVSALLEGDMAHALGAFAPAFAGLAIGACAGALAGAACAFALFKRADA